MPSLMKAVLFSVLFVPVSTCISSAQTMSPDTKSLGSVARELRAEKSAQHPAPPTSQTSSLETAAAIVNDPPEIQRFMDQARVLLMREEFAELDRIADDVRSTKARFPGGGWRLYHTTGRLDDERRMQERLHTIQAITTH